MLKLDLKIDKTSAKPIYHQLSQGICRQVRDAKLVADDKLPTEVELAKQLSVNRLTVGRCYEQLKEMGVIVSYRGKGTYVTSNAYEVLNSSKTQTKLGSVAFVLGASMENVPPCNVPIVMAYMEGATYKLREERYDMCFCPIDANGCRHDDSVVDGIMEHSGVIFLGDAVRRYDVVQKCLENKIPSVALSPTYETSLPTVTYSCFDAVKGAVEYLHGKGVESLGYIGRVDGGDSKFMGFVKTTATLGMKADIEHIIELEHSNQLGKTKLPEIIAKGKLPEVLFVDTDKKAMEVINFLEMRGLKVPEDVGVLGYDDISGTEQFHVPVSVVHVPMREMGAKAAEMVLNPHLHPGQKVILETTIKERKSFF